ncbi:MAG: hypothetical protein EBX50_01520 [Chitinophagia bacterium]|nr:hypothetical protein [Chitinophagia bacterium]
MNNFIDFLISVQEQEHTYCQSCGEACEIDYGAEEDYCEDCLSNEQYPNSEPSQNEQDYDGDWTPFYNYLTNMKRIKK